MALDSGAPRSRRALLAGALAAGAATVATAVDRPGLTRAADNGNVVLGQTNTATQVTVIDVGANGDAIKGVGTATGLWGVGNNGVYAQSTASGAGNNGVFGWSSGATGYTGGVSGQADSPQGVGIWGWASANGSGAMGISGTDTTTAAPANTGVWGWAAQDATARGVHGQTTAGQGVRGEATSGVGVYATSTTGTALQVAGKAKFSRSGKASVLAGKTYVDVTVPGGLATNTVVHATLQTYRSGVAIAAARKNYPTTGKVRIYLTKVGSTTASTSVAWIATEY